MTTAIDENYFEGVEKLLEIWFEKPSDNTNCDLRLIPRKCLEGLLKTVHCEVVSFSRNDKVDAYVLSESSMFVSERRFILKTCGTTTPLECLKLLLTLVQHYAGFTQVEEVFYSRKNFKKPELQKSPHKSFEQEVSFLDTFFKGGVGFCLGHPKEDCWYLYTLNGAQGIESISEDLENLKEHDGPVDPDQTLEVLMTDLDPKIMAIFTKEQCSSAPEATKKSGIDTILPQMTIDDYLFDPCGYSMNGIGKNGSYMTIHITPEPEFSYVSFETNSAEVSYLEVIERVVDVFRPGKCVVTVFANKSSDAADVPFNMKTNGKYKILGDLQCREVKYCQLRNYDLGFAFYSKFPS